MGIYINLEISKSVTKEEWKRVYEETLILAKKLSLAGSRKMKIHDIDVCCLAPVEEFETNDLYFGTWRGWGASGDYNYLETAEYFLLPKELVGDRIPDPYAGDAMLGVDDSCLSMGGTYSLWGRKSQGMPYHIDLLAIAALIEARLGRKAFTYGDIMLDQFERWNLLLKFSIKRFFYVSMDKYRKFGYDMYRWKRRNMKILFIAL